MTLCISGSWSNDEASPRRLCITCAIICSMTSPRVFCSPYIACTLRALREERMADVALISDRVNCLSQNGYGRIQMRVQVPGQSMGSGGIHPIAVVWQPTRTMPN